jgi:hypothetical protein
MSIAGDLAEEFTRNELQPQIDELKRQNAELLAAFKRYARHHRSCRVVNSWLDTEVECSCGYRNAIAKVGVK